MQYVSLLNVDLCLLHSDPDPFSQPMAKARVLYVYVIPFFVSAALPRSRTVAIWAVGMKIKKKKKKKHWAQYRAEIVFSCVKSRDHV